MEAYGLQSGMLRIMSTPSTSGYEIAAVGTGTQLRRFGCQTVGGESWCEIHTIDGGVRGWARERYLRQVGNGGQYGTSGQGSGYSAPYNSGDGGSGMRVEAYGLQSGMLRIMSTPSTSGYEIAAVATGTRLLRFGCQTINSESWCEVHTIDGGVRGWARERYLRRY